jgi:hypothetical protein
MHPQMGTHLGYSLRENQKKEQMLGIYLDLQIGMCQVMQFWTEAVLAAKPV